MVQYIPHAELSIFYQTTGGLVTIPVFRGAVTGPLKNARHFYKQANLSDFYTPAASHTQILNSSDETVYYSSFKTSASGSYSYPNLNTNYFAIDTDEVKYAMDEIFWRASDPTTPIKMLPYYTDIQGYFNRMIAMTATGDMSSTGNKTTPVLSNSSATIDYPQTLTVHWGSTHVFGVPTTGSNSVGVPVAIDATKGIDSSGVTGAATLDIGGTFSGDRPLDFRITIDGDATPDTFKWEYSDDGSTWTTGGSTVAITGAAQTLMEGVTITFSSTTSANLNDVWLFTAYACMEDLFASTNYIITGTPATVTAAAAAGETLYVAWETDGSLSMWNGSDGDVVRANWGTTVTTEGTGIEGKSTGYTYVRDTTGAGTRYDDILESLYRGTGNILNTLYTDGSSNKHYIASATAGGTASSPTGLVTLLTSVDLREIIVPDASSAYDGIPCDGFYYYDTDVSYKMDLTPVLPVSGTSVGDVDIIAVASIIRPNTDTAYLTPASATDSDDTIAICKAHVAYLADWVTTDSNPYVNSLIKSSNTTFAFAQDTTYPWGVPHPDNPLGFAYKIMSDFLPESITFDLLVAATKSKGFALANKNRNIMFIGNVWDEYGQDGLDEDAWLLAREAKYDHRIVITWVNFSDKNYRMGSDSAYNARQVTVTLDSKTITKNGADQDFTTLGVEPGDVVVLAQAGSVVITTTVTSVAASTIQVLDTLATALFSGTLADIKIYKQYTSEEVKDNLITAQSSTNPGLVKQFNRYVKWGSSFISNKWFVPAIVAQKLSLPEHQPLTNIVLNSGSYGAVYGDYEFFDEDDLDALVGAGYYIYSSDPNDTQPYAIREVTCGISTGDVYKGNLNAVTPVRTYAASLFSAISRNLGKYNIVSDAIDTVRLAVTAVSEQYVSSPVTNLGTRLKKAVVLSIEEAEDGLDIEFEALPQKSINVIRGSLYVRSDQ